MPRVAGAPVRRCRLVRCCLVGPQRSPHAPMVRRGVRAGAAVSTWFNANKCDLHSRSLGVAGVRLTSLNCTLGVCFPLYLRHSWSEKTRFAVFYRILLMWKNPFCSILQHLVARRNSVSLVQQYANCCKIAQRIYEAACAIAKAP